MVFFVSYSIRVTKIVLRCVVMFSNSDFYQARVFNCDYICLIKLNILLIDEGSVNVLVAFPQMQVASNDK